MSLPASDLDRSSDWYERVFGFRRVLIEEDEDHVTMVMLEHPEGMLLCLHQSPDLRGGRSATAPPGRSSATCS